MKSLLLINSFSNSHSNFDKGFISLEHSGLILIIIVIVEVFYVLVLLLCLITIMMKSMTLSGILIITNSINLKETKILGGRFLECKVFFN